MTIREIAKQAGVSPATVSRYLNGTHKISTKKSREIKRVLTKNGIQPPSFLKIADRIVGVSVPNLECRFYSEILREILDQIPNYNLQVVFLPSLEKDRQSFCCLVKRLNLSGIIFLEENIKQNIWDLLRKLHLKAVMCGSASIDSQVAMVHINDLAAAYEATKYLISLGHKKIAFLSDYPYSVSVGFQRLAGCRKAMEEANLQFDEKLVCYSDVFYKNGYLHIQKLLQNRMKFTAVFAFSDEMAIGAMDALYDNGLCVPEDVSVMGFDDLSIASRVRPALTTVHQPLKQIVKKTLDIFSGEDFDMINTAITLPYRLCVRESCRKIDQTEGFE